jgi:hypothetical protein
MNRNVSPPASANNLVLGNSRLQPDENFMRRASKIFGDVRADARGRIHRRGIE